MLKIGTPAPTFTATSTDNREIRLSDLRGRHVVLFFFPKAFTTGCTIESKQFRDVYSVIQRLNGEVIGISIDKHQTQCDFAASFGAGYPMIGDEDGRISKMYDVVRPILSVDRRVTYVIDDEGIIQGVFSHELLVGKHVENVLDCLQKLERDRGRGPKMSGDGGK